ncbi:MAG: DNA replication/repair protein RecF [Candidatus Hydrogenedens sp.]
MKNFYARSFRCITDLNVEFHPEMNIIIGANAQGKTSLLEAVHFLSLARSLRTNNERELVQYEKDGFLLKGEVISDEKITESIFIDMKWVKGDKRIHVNGIGLERVSELIGKMRIVFLTSDFSDLVSEGASHRRRFMDVQLSQMDSGYLHALQGYQRALRQRNELLRKPDVKQDELWVWELQMAEFARTLIGKRSSFIKSIKPFASDIHTQIISDEKLEICYLPDVAEEVFLKKLEENRNTDIQRGQTIHGPHRDDIEVRINGYPVRQYASQGQKKTCAYAIRISEIYLSKEGKKDCPIVLADELFSDIDPQRGKKFLETIPEGVQVIITAVDEIFCRNLERNFDMYRIRRGSLERSQE